MCNRNAITIPDEEDMSKYSILRQVGGRIEYFQKEYSQYPVFAFDSKEDYNDYKRLIMQPKKNKKVPSFSFGNENIERYCKQLNMQKEMI